MATLSSPTLAKLITNVRNFLNQPNPNNSFWTDAELTDYINKGIQRYFGEIVQTGEGQFTTTTTLSITSGVETVALPSDFFEMKTLHIQRANGYDILEYRNDITSGFSNIGNNSVEMYRPYYFFRGNNIVLRPVPNVTQANVLLLQYVQFPEMLLNAGDVLSSQVNAVFTEVIELYAVYKAKLKESLVSGVNMHATAQANLGDVYNQFKESMEKRSQYPEFVVPFNPELD